ncbi:hypothetical protein Baya_15599 [Bagarius yarrelli]|uniref:Uncharacterized protein n=1 Tax=Bagarius yarrelli TaxID=175774 RepID=A0A556VCR4_BAGYA|nr:hypothetical protein Baya_15599 [Bagarius yarrelli]
MPSYLWLTPARRRSDLPLVNPHPSSLSSLHSLQSALHLHNLRRHLSTALSLGEGPRAPFRKKKKVQSLTEDGKVLQSDHAPIPNPTTGQQKPFTQEGGVPGSQVRNSARSVPALTERKPDHRVENSQGAWTSPPSF